MLSTSGFMKTVSTMPGGVGEEVLRELAKPSQKPRNHERIVVMSSADRKMLECLVVESGKNFRFTLKIGTQEGLFIKEVRGSCFSLRVREGIIEVGRGLPTEEIRIIANQIVGEYITSNLPCGNAVKKGRNRIGYYSGGRHKRQNRLFFVSSPA